MTLTGVTASLAALALHRQLLRALPRPAGAVPLRRQPSVSVVRPVRGVDSGALENFLCALRTDYPGSLEHIFVVDDQNEPALPLIEQAIARTPGRSARVLIAGPPPPGRTGKLHAMLVGLRQARHELVAFVDSDVRESQESLRALVATLLENPRAGAAFLPVAVKEAPLTVGDAGYALLVNGLYSPAAAMAARRSGGELPFIMGQMMIFRRQALAAIGGLERASGQLVDDMYLGAAVAAAGMTNAVGTQTVALIQSGMSLGAFLQTFVRWLAFARTGLPGRSFKSIPWRQGLLFWVGLLLLAIGLWTGAWPVALSGGLAALVVAIALNDLHERLAGHRLALRHAWVSSALLMVGPLVVLRTHFSREVVWRGRRYRLDRQARLEEQPVFRSREA